MLNEVASRSARASLLEHSATRYLPKLAPTAQSISVRLRQLLPLTLPIPPVFETTHVTSLQLITSCELCPLPALWSVAQFACLFSFCMRSDPCDNFTFHINFLRRCPHSRNSAVIYNSILIDKSYSPPLIAATTTTTTTLFRNTITPRSRINDYTATTDLNGGAYN